MYKHGSKLILYVGNKAIGHCSSLEIDDSAETKSRSIKSKPDYSEQESDSDLQPAADEDKKKDGLWEEKSVSKRNVTINAEGFVCDDESGISYDDLLDLMDNAEPVKAKYAYDGEENVKYRVGKFIITALKLNTPSDDDVTYSLTLENTGRVRTKRVANQDANQDADPENN